ncbi:MAG: DUF3859 domain-containing protein [Gammaproteobacteria bacterium]|nr:DUF3859 domain-containing protein [Gammaproteobacteria bacterium]
MKYLITCLIVAVLAGCEQASDTTGKQDSVSDAAGTAVTTTEDQAVPEEVKNPSGRVFEYGIYNPIRKGRVRDEMTSNTGKVINLPVLELGEQTDHIPLVKDTYFAYRYRILNLPKDEAKKPAVELRKVLVHPEMKLPDGGSSTGWDRVTKGRTSAGHVIGFDGYAFNEDYELVEGDWTFQIWFREHLLVEQTFTMYWPEEGAEAGAGAEQPATEPAAENSI